MRSVLGFASLAAVLGILSGVFSAAAAQGSCTGLCTQQVSCPNGGTTSISGTVYAPNGTDPLPNVLVFVPNATPAPFTAGVSCPAPGAAPSGSPLVGSTSAVDGTFTITNVPVGTNIPLVIQSGRWRRQLVVSSTTACANTDFSTRMPRNQSEGDIPRFAVVTGDADQVECVLRKVGVDDREFTNPGGSGRINLYLGEDSAGAEIDTSTPSESQLMNSTPSVANDYDVIMLPCQGAAAAQGTPKAKTPTELQNFVNFANAGGRVYASHYSWSYMVDNPYLPAVANWQVNQNYPDINFVYSYDATVDTSFSQGDTLAQWMQLVGATTTEGQIDLSTLRHDMNGVVPPTQSWLKLEAGSELATPSDPNPVMQFVYNAPVAAKNQCGRVLFNEYHVENNEQTSSPNAMSTFPNECAPGTTLSAQEKLLEYMLFELTNDGGQPTLTPASADFGSQPLGFATAPQTFTWTNNSTFPASATTEITPGFNVVSNDCQNVQASGSCHISVDFQPSVLGPQTGVLTVNSSGPSITAALTGIGTPDLIFTHVLVQFGNHDVGSSTLQTIAVTNGASGTVPVPAITTTGDYGATTTCGSNLAAGAGCSIIVAFKPSTTGDRPGTLIVGANVPTQLDGNGIDFALAVSPASGKVEAGLGIASQVTATPIAGFSAGISLSCTTNAPAATCAFANGAVTLSAPVTVSFSVATTAEYKVIGYGGMGSRGWLWLAGAASGLLLLLPRRRASRLLRGGLTVALFALILVGGSLGLTGCSGQLPARNASYTPGGTYSVTLTATDGFLVHTATYSLVVTAP